MPETKVHEEFNITRLTDGRAGERVWELYAVFETLPQAEQAFGLLPPGDFRLERRTVTVLQGPTR